MSITPIPDQFPVHPPCAGMPDHVGVQFIVIVQLQLETGTQCTHQLCALALVLSSRFLSLFVNLMEDINNFLATTGLHRCPHFVFIVQVREKSCSMVQTYSADFWNCSAC